MDPHIAVVGCGRWGKNHVRNFSELGALRTVCDASTALLSAVREQYPGVHCETSYEKVLGDDAIKGIVLATPAAMHYEMAKAAMEAGKDVLVEKPLALKVEDGEDLVRVAEETGRILMIGHLLYYHPAIEKLNEMVKDGVLGKIFYISSNRLNFGQFRNEENILWSFAPHDISVTLLLLNEFPESVSANGGSYLQEDVADITTTGLVFPSGSKAHIYVNWLHPFKEQKLVVIGDRRMAVFDDVKSEDKLTLHDYSIRWNGAIPTAPASNEHTAVELETHEPLRKECQHFLDCVETRQTPKTDGRNGLAVLRVLDACQRSLDKGGEVIALQAALPELAISLSD